MSKRLNMSNDEAVEWLLSLKNLDICGENRKTAIDKAIKALEQQPCEDCISREEALLALTGMDLPTDRDKLIALFTERIQQMPSVTPERPKGKWIDDGDCIICNKCLKAFGWISMNMASNFCPNCGSYNGGGEADD